MDNVLKFIATIELSDYIAFFSLTVSVISLIYAWRSNMKRFELKEQYKYSVFVWYNDTVQVIMRIKEGLSSGDEYADPSDLAQLSALIDSGRFFFPNTITKDEKNDNNALAYKGRRHIALDCLVAIYKTGKEYRIPTESGQLYYDGDLAAYVDSEERHFTSIIFKILEVRQWNEERAEALGIKPIDTYSREELLNTRDIK